MKKKIDIEIAVGIFIFIGIVCLAYTAVQLGQIELFDKNYYEVKAIFTTVKGLKKDQDVEIAGVRVGKVKDIQLDDYHALVTLLIKNGIAIQDDAIASVRTKGILGEKYVEIAPGGSDELVKPGGMIFDTEPPIDLESLIKNFVFEKVDKDKKE